MDDKKHPISFDPRWHMIEHAPGQYTVVCCGCQTKKQVYAASATLAIQTLMDTGWQEWLTDGWECSQCQQKREKK